VEWSFLKKEPYKGEVMRSVATDTSEHTRANEPRKRLLDPGVAGYDEDQLLVIFVYWKFVT